MTIYSINTTDIQDTSIDYAIDHYLTQHDILVHYVSRNGIVYALLTHCAPKHITWLLLQYPDHIKEYQECID